MGIKVIEPRVESLLAASRDNRNSDKKLIIAYMEKYHGLYLNHSQKAIFMSMPSFESITRARRELRPQHPGDDDIEQGRFELYQKETLDHSKKRSVV